MAEKGNAKSDKKGTLTFEKAVSGRSTCRATGDSIAKGEDRVGLEAYVGGRVAMTWQVGLVLPAVDLSCRACLPLPITHLFSFL